MASSKDTGKDDDLNDFDVDDDDLADLLYDDDDEKPLKKEKSPQSRADKESEEIFTEKPAEAKSTQSPVKKKLNLRENFSLLEKKFGSSEDKEEEKDSDNNDDSLTKILQDKKGKKEAVSPAKSGGTKSKIDDFFSEESKYIADLDLDELSNKKVTSPDKASPKNSQSAVTSAKPPFKKSDDIDFEDSDILDTLDDEKEKPRGRGFMDELLASPKVVSAKSTPKKLDFLLENTKKASETENEPNDESGIGSYIPSSARGRSARAGRRQNSLFEDEDSAFSPSKSQDKHSTAAKGMESPKKTPSHRAGFSGLEEFKLSSPLHSSGVGSKNPKSAGKTGNDDGDDDWINLLRSKKQQQQKTSISANENKDQSKTELGKTDVTGSRRKSSGADWLGFKPSEVKGSSVDSPVKGILNKSSTEIKFESPSRVPRKQPEESKGQAKYPWLTDSEEQLSTKSKVEAAASLPKTAEKQPDPVQKTSVQSKLAQSLPLNSTNQQLAPEVLKSGTDNLNSQISSGKVSGSSPHTVPLAEVQHHQQYATSSEAVSSALPATYNPVFNPSGYGGAAPHSHGVNADLIPLQALVSSLQSERDQLIRSAEFTKKQHEEQLKALENSLKSQQKTSEEALELKIKSIKQEHEGEVEKLKAKLATLEEEKKKAVDSLKSKLENLDADHRREIKKLKRLHDEAVTMLKQDHEDALGRLKRLKDQEIEAISSTQLQAKSLQSLSDQLEMRASELAALQVKVEAKHQAAFHEKEALLSAKEKDLKALESRLRWQTEEGEQERIRLQQLVLRLESRLQEQTKEGEQDRWEVQQLKTKLEVQQKFLDEEKKTQAESIEREKDRLRSTQNSLIQEQKAILYQLAQERQQLANEKMEIESLAKKVKAEELRLNARKLQEESSLESQRRMIQNEEEKLSLEKELRKQEGAQIRREKEAVQRERKQLKDERASLEELRLELKKRENELDEITQRAASDRDHGKSALAAARKIEADHQTRLNQLAQQMQMLLEREKQLFQDREKFVEEKAAFEKTKSSVLCANCKVAVGLPVTVLPPGVNQVRQPAPIIAVSSGIPQQSNVDPNLMVWYLTAQKDREYLQEELEFLHSLKEFTKK